MTNIKLLKILLIPFSLLYGLVVLLRDYLYRKQILKSVKFSVPVIGVGNLAIGGSGKTPHVMYLIKLLSPFIKVATMSRGYRRKTKGFRMVNYRDTVDHVGDEALLLKRKFPNVPISVSEDRSLGIPQLISNYPETQAVILDDAFQHRGVEPYINILLTAYSKPFTKDWLMPSGRLREGKSASKRADIVVLTKCPEDLSKEKARSLSRELATEQQSMYFSRFNYGKAYYLFNPRYGLNLDKDLEIILISAIANTDYLLSYLDANTKEVYSFAYEDHHDFTDREVSQLAQSYTNLKAAKKVILTTEKDAVRLIKHQKLILEKQLPLFVLPVEVEFLFNQQEEFNNDIKKRLLEFKY